MEEERWGELWSFSLEIHGGKEEFFFVSSLLYLLDIVFFLNMPKPKALITLNRLVDFRRGE